jgi:ParB family chromosome partitioning protein
MKSLLADRDATLQAVLGPGEGDRVPPATAGAEPPADDAPRTAAPPSANTASPPPVGEAPAARSSPAPASLAGRQVEERALTDVRPSAFQPAGRPSTAAVAAVERAIREAGALDTLVSTEGALVFARLDAEAARLAELAYDVSVHGVRDPVETRIADDGAEECLSGHRRMAAARLAGLATVPVLPRGEMSNANAAATVLSGNLHREDFTPWQEAVLVTEVKERRGAERMPSDVRSLGRVMGWATGKVQARLKLRRAISDRLLAGLEDPATLERINRVGANELNRIADTPDDLRRLPLLRRALGMAPVPSEGRGEDVAQVLVHRPRRGGGFVLEVRQEIEAMPAGDLALVREMLHAQLTRVEVRLQQLTGPRPG